MCRKKKIKVTPFVTKNKQSSALVLSDFFIKVQNIVIYGSRVYTIILLISIVLLLYKLKLSTSIILLLLLLYVSISTVIPVLVHRIDHDNKRQSRE